MNNTDRRKVAADQYRLSVPDNRDAIENAFVAGMEAEAAHYEDIIYALKRIGHIPCIATRANNTCAHCIARDSLEGVE